VSSSLLMGWMCAKASTDKIIAIVNNNVITQSELDNKVAVIKQHLERTASAPTSTTQLRKKVLNDLIDKDLQVQIAERNELKVSDQEVSDAISSIAQRNKLTSAQLQQELLKQGIKYQDFRKQIHDDILISRVAQQMVSGKINVTEQEIEAFMHKANSARAIAVGGGKEYHLLDVLVPTSAKQGDKEYDDAKKVVADVLDQLHKGGLVEEVARKITFAGKPLVGTDLGWRDSASLPEQFKSILPQLKPRDAAGPIIAPNGMHIVILVDMRQMASANKQALPQMTYAEAREAVYHSKMEKALKPRLQQLRATAYIKIMDSSLSDDASASE
jgi:peptidyl-prolyl cis-trans isomerase SurA